VSLQVDPAWQRHGIGLDLVAMVAKTVDANSRYDSRRFLEDGDVRRQLSRLDCNSMSGDKLAGSNRVLIELKIPDRCDGRLINLVI
jgi:hypothetical protein